ncbi:interferon-induced protein with tetratricopeptide repeats 2-like [Neopsephotus bourkii]|uniref:interferon-induced protein with tetratricopeptide repeats 2-like n=1 Tax=Neopsephotus bourkii TaxID=309878 RepID=UPI002AA5B9CC|nr:interferon-induced protein with tetratricopeptide repeats 2-like [Neopsephotus bourkii]
MSKKELKEKLDALQCHFTWRLSIAGHIEVSHVLQKLAVEIKYTPHQNQAPLLGLQAYLYQLEGQSRAALQSLKDAEEYERQDKQQASVAGSLVIYGNYAWIHYLQASYQEAESYLQQVEQLCTTPLDAQLIPYIQAQKGWSLLAIRARNGERARECFEVALMLEPENRNFHAGLGMALYSCWNYFWYPDIAEEARIQLEKAVLENPNNYRAKMCLAMLLEQVNTERSISLIEENVEKSSDPDVLKASASFWLKRKATEKAIKILQQALEQNPGYHLLYQALAKCYKKQWLNANNRDKNNILEAAIKDLNQILQEHPDLVFVKLQLAEFYGARDPAQEEKIYRELQERKETLSLKSLQALNLYWGNFFYKKSSLDEAKAKFMDGYRIPVATAMRRKCAQKLIQLAQCYQGEAAAAIYRFMEDTDRHLPAEFSAAELE